MTRPARDNNGSYTYNGIDRLDNSLGYTLDNVVASCWDCNRAKQDLTVGDFLIWVLRVTPEEDFIIPCLQDIVPPKGIPYAKYAHSAKTRGLAFKLGRGQAAWLFTGRCAYCGTTPSEQDGLTYNGIDRVDNSKGYVEGNVVSCCATCNKAKNRYPLKDFLSWAARVQEHQSRVASIR